MLLAIGLDGRVDLEAVGFCPARGRVDPKPRDRRGRKPRLVRARFGPSGCRSRVGRYGQQASHDDGSSEKQYWRFHEVDEMADLSVGGRWIRADSSGGSARGILPQIDPNPAVELVVAPLAFEPSNRPPADRGVRRRSSPPRKFGRSGRCAPVAGTIASRG